MGRRVTGLEATRLFKSIMKPLYWCRHCGIPLYTRRCPLCGSRRLHKVRLTQPGDVRPAFERDYEITRDAIRHSLGDEAEKRLLPPNTLMLLNRVQAIDAADEVIVGGYTIGVRMFDIVGKRWIFKPDYLGVVLVYEEGLGPHAYATKTLKPGDVLERSDLRLEGDTKPGLFIALFDGRKYGVGKVLESGAVRVQKVFEFDRRTLNSWSPSRVRFEQVVEAHSEYLESIEKEAVDFLKSVLDKGEPLIALSGGKDSTVAAALAVEAGVDRAYFFDTGIEFPETVETAKKVADALSLKLIEISADDLFWKALPTYGPPARDYRWCCKVVKFGPLEKGLRRFIHGRMLAITGQRAFESTARAQAGRLAPSASSGRGQDLVAAPIQYWTSLEVHMYIAWKRLPLNPLYTKGYERVGCYLCPASRLAEIEAIRETHSRLWARWENELLKFARETGLPREWVTYGFWRWRFSYPAEIQHLARRLGLNPHEMIRRSMLRYVIHSVEPSLEGYTHVLIPRVRASKVNLEQYKRLLCTTRLAERAQLEGDKLVISDKELGVEARVYNDGRVEVLLKRRRVDKFKLGAFMKKVLAPLYMMLACSGCGVCVASCPNNAMRAPHNPDPSLCKGCSLCVNLCPAGGKLASHAVRVIEESV